MKPARNLGRLLRRGLVLTAAGGLGLVVQGRADDTVPKAYPADRYEKMAAHSPFSPPTEAPKVQATPTPPPAPSWADKLTATMIMQYGNDYKVTVVDQDSPTHLQLYTNVEDDQSHMQVASVKWNAANRDETPTITLRRGTDFAQVRYEPGNSSMPGAVGGNPALARPAGLPGVNNFRPPGGAPPIPGSMPQAGVNVQAPTVNNALRRAPIRAVPQAPAPGGRPIVMPGAANPPGQPVRTAPAIKTDDDDDDD